MIKGIPTHAATAAVIEITRGTTDPDAILRTRTGDSSPLNGTEQQRRRQ